jgi:hypothetical protein
MADVYIVFLAKGGGEIGGVFSTLALATSYATVNRPPCNWTIVQRSVDDAPTATLTGQYLSTGPAASGVVKQGHRNS